MERISKLNLQPGAGYCLQSRGRAPRAGKVARFALADGSDARRRERSEDAALASGAMYSVGEES